MLAVWSRHGAELGATAHALAGFTQYALGAREGVFVYQRRKSACVFWSPDTDSLETVPRSQDWMVTPPAWDEARGSWADAG